MKININTILICISVIVGSWLMRKPSPTKELEKYLLKKNEALRDTISNREREITQIKIDILKSHENEKDVINTLPNAPVEQLDSIWERFFDKYSN